MTQPNSTDARTRLAGALAGQEDRLLPCVHCGFCLPACPTYRRLGDENDSPRGRLYLMRAVVEGRLEPASDAFQEHIDRCLGCRACEPVCPSGVEYGFLLEKAREVASETRPHTGVLRRMLRTFGSRTKTRRAMTWGRRLRDSGLAGLLERIVPAGGFARFGLSMLNATRPVPLTGLKGGPSPDKDAGDFQPLLRDDGTAVRVALLTGCVQEGLYERVNAATRRVLVANGFEVVEVKNQGCCGALHAHAGAQADAASLARDNVRVFTAAEVDFVVANAAGCGAMMKDYGSHFEDDSFSELAQSIGASVRDVSEVLASVGPRPGAPLEVAVTYDSPCHLEHAQGVRDEVDTLFGAIPGLHVAPLPGSDECCGGAGVYGLTHPELGGRIGSDKVDAVLGTGVELVATGNPGCMMQIGAGLRARGSRMGVVHPVELLDESYRRAGYYG